MTSNEACVSGSPATSNTISMTVNPILAASVSVVESTNIICEGSAVTFTATPTNGGITPTYQWQLNGTDLTDETISTYTSSSLADADQLKCIMTSSEACVYGSPATSNVVTITVNAKPSTPIITQYVTTQNENLLHSDALAGNQWYNANGLINGAVNQDYAVISNGTYYDIVTINGCSSDPSISINIVTIGVDVTSNNKSIEVYPNPVSNELTIEIKGGTHKTEFEIYNSTGQIIYKGNLLEKTVVQTTNFIPGIYIVKLDNGKIFEFKRIIKK